MLDVLRRSEASREQLDQARLALPDPVEVTPGRRPWDCDICAAREAAPRPA